MQLVREQLGKVGITVDKDYWSIDRAYDRLVIVEVKGEFRTYISRKPVPAGVLLNDREYWIPFSSLKEELISNYNAWLNKVDSLLGETPNQLTLDEEIREIDSMYARITNMECLVPGGIIATFILRNCSFDEESIAEYMGLNTSLLDIYSGIPSTGNTVSNYTEMFSKTIHNNEETIRIYVVYHAMINSTNNYQDVLQVTADEGYYLDNSSYKRVYPSSGNVVSFSDGELSVSIRSTCSLVIKAKKNG